MREWAVGRQVGSVGGDVQCLGGERFDSFTTFAAASPLSLEREALASSPSLARLLASSANRVFSSLARLTIRPPLASEAVRASRAAASCRRSSVSEWITPAGWMGEGGGATNRGQAERGLEWSDG